ncbi:MAG TPA: adenylyl-sulfate kinase [Bryobacteraceae bacterium]|nr:adenylyl-sulfate kinase [Bryobacteraceae bacterium]
MASKPAFAVWITGLPASGKSTIAHALKKQLEARGIDAAVLESDELRRILTPHPTYDPEERERFYRAMIHTGRMLVKHGIPVIFDATANRRVWREQARREIPRFIEIYAECPLEVCMARDPKGIYRRGRESGGTVPGLHEPYEAPENPEVVIPCEHGDPEEAAAHIIFRLIEAGFVPCERG